MTPERWKQVDVLLKAALELQPNQIAPFLDSACADDTDLRQEIERLLAADGGAESFIESRVFDRIPQTSDPENMIAVLSGTKEESSISERGLLADRYQLISKLGKGGMGEVWHAYDLRLRVDVALKSLRVNLRKNPEYIELLRKEVRSAREVISPNVCRIFDLVVVDHDQELISMEYIDGTTLSDLLGQSGPLHITKARDIAAQFLAGLEAIHQAGLVHRDLKPENIMITRTGRVVVMDFGISQEIANMAGKVAGTLPYMSPEQISGSHVDGRSDIFAAGVVLAEMIHTKGPLSDKTRSMIWNALRVDAKRIPESPWKSVITRAVALNPEDRFQNVGTLVRALEEVTQQIEGIDDQRPYPGLAAFSSSDAEYFFGRELEVETIIKKMQQCPMIAMIGPSGAGKTSFLRAGLLPALPKDWCSIVTTPGDAPILNLAESLSRSIGNPNQFEDPDNAVHQFLLLRKSYKEIVLIVDRFEELFILNSPSVQTRYSEILSHLAFDADVRVVLSMRDDFLFFCEAHDSLRLIFSDLTPIAPLRGASLRRALVEPALKCGYRFEDERMVDFILSDVENERGALSLTAFAMARLWEKRDRKNGLLTRQAYKEIGGISGALAQYAEKIFELMTPQKQNIVREIFRNLVTAQNTRVARDWNELLSVFPEKNIAEEVLHTLIDARLLTSFDAPSAETSTRRRVEVVHESLLTAWPRLVRWQTQDAESAQMRDQLRQASQVWNQGAQSADLLWTGAAFLEFQAWRQRYPGRLTATEEAFAQAMAQHAGRKRKRRQFTITATFLLLVGVLTAITLLWRNASSERDKAIQQSRRAEGARVLAVARSLDKLDPSTKLAYALYSLEFADTPDARQFAMQAMAEGPAYHALRIENISTQMSPDGKWIAAEQPGGSVVLVPQSGSTPVVLNEADTGHGNHIPWYPQFSPDSNLVVWTSRKDVSMIKVWSIPQKKLIRKFSFEGVTICFVRGGKAFFISDDGGVKGGFGWKDSLIRVWDFGASNPQLLGKVHLEGGNWKTFDIDYSAQSIAYPKDDRIFMEDLNRLGLPRLVGTDPGRDILQVRFNPNGSQVASGNGKGEIKLWSLVSGAPQQPVRIFAGNGQKLFNFWFDGEGRTLISSREGQIFQWDLAAPPDADPIVWRQDGGGYYGSFDNQQHWQEIAGGPIAVYNYSPPQSYTFKGAVPAQSTANVRFLPDGKSFISGFAEDGISIHTLPGVTPPVSRIVWNDWLWSADSLEIDGSGQHFAAPTDGGGVYIVSIPDGKATELKGLAQFQYYGTVALSPDGKTVAAKDKTSGVVELWNIDTGNSRVLPHSQSTSTIRYSPDGTLFSVDDNRNLCRWDLKNDSFAIVARNNYGNITFSQDGRMIGSIAWLKDRSEVWLYDLRTGKSSVLESHGHRVESLAFDHKATRIITGDADGIVRVGPITGETPYLLLGHQSGVHDVTVSADDQWILSIEDAHPVVKLWRMPQGREKPLQSLSTSEFKNAIRRMTNVRVVEDDALPVGYRTTLEPFRGWTKGREQR